MLTVKNEYHIIYFGSSAELGELKTTDSMGLGAHTTLHRSHTSVALTFKCHLVEKFPAKNF